MNHPRAAGLRSRLLSRRWLSPRCFECGLERPPSLAFVPGQSVRIGLEGVERDYTMASGPSEEGLTLCVLHLASGAFSPRLASAEIGTPLTLTGPNGFFVLHESAHSPVFIATGTGVAPFLSMTRAGAAGFLLAHGVREAEELYYRRELSGAAAEYVPCISGSPAGGIPAGAFGGRVTDWLRDHLAPGAHDFYLCGRREMVRDVTLLADEKFPGSRVFTEIFF